MRVNLLGEPYYEKATGEEEPLEQSPFAHVLLGRLAFTRGPVQRSELRRCLWPEEESVRPPVGRDDGLNTYATAVRRALGFVGKPKKPIRSLPGGSMVLDRPGSTDRKATVEIETDLDEFRQGLKTGTPEALRQALALVRGPFLAGIEAHRFPWLQEAREKVERECVEAAQRLTGSEGAAAVVRDFLGAPAGTLLDALEPELLERDEDKPAAAPAKRFRPGRVAVAIASLLVVAAIGTGLAAAIGGEEEKASASGPSGRAEAAAEEMNVSSAHNLTAGLRIANRTLDDHWATRVDADPTDRLAFALTLENSAPERSYPLTAWVEHEDDPEGEYGHQQLRLLLARPNGEVLLETPWVRVEGWTNQFGAFWLVNREKAGMGVMRTVSGELLRTLGREYGGVSQTIPWPLRGALDFGRGLESLPIGRLESGQRVLVEFLGSWDVQDSFGVTFGNIDPTFEVEGSSAPEPVSIGSARIGDRLTFFVLLDDQGNFASPAEVRVDFRAHKGGRYIEMRAFAAQFEPEQLLGTATINSGDGRPIALAVVPGSTELLSRRPGPWMYEPDCPAAEAPVDTRTLDDGIALGGVDIGEFGGFNPHTNCAGTETTKQLRFKATVLAR